MFLIGFAQDMIAVPPHCAEWYALAAGLLATTVSECALCSGAPDRRMVEEADRRALLMTDITRCRMLRSIIALADDAALDPLEYRDVLRAQLMAYGHTLQADGRYAAAVDVFTMLASRAGDDTDLRMDALNQRAFSLRSLYRWDDAEASYEMMKIVARQVRSQGMGLAADFGLAKLLVDRGRTGEGEKATAVVVSRAKRLRDEAILGHALIDLARLAGVRRDPVSVIEHSHSALRAVFEPYRRDRIFINMAYAFREIRRPVRSARLAGHVLRHGQHADQRAFARLVLYNLSIDAGDWIAAETHRSQFSASTMAPDIEAEYHEATARHMATAGDTAQALAALEKMATLTSNHSLAELATRAEQAVADVRRGIIPAIYEFRPIERIPKHKQRMIASIEEALDLLQVG